MRGGQTQLSHMDMGKPNQIYPLLTLKFIYHKIFIICLLLLCYCCQTHVTFVYSFLSFGGEALLFGHNKNNSNHLLLLVHVCFFLFLFTHSLSGYFFLLSFLFFLIKFMPCFLDLLHGFLSF